MKDRFLFSHEPIEQQTAVYQNTLAKCVEVFSTYPGIRAIYQYGSVSTPGISDLDLLLVFDENSPSIPYDWRKWFNSQERYLLLHNPSVISPSLLAEGVHITFLQGLNLLWGTPTSVNKADDKTADFLSHLIVMEHTIRLLVTTIRQLQAQIVKQRPLLCELHSIRYDLNLLGLAAQWETAFTQPMYSLRQNWFTLPPITRQTQLLSLFRQAPSVQQTVLHKVAEWGAGLEIRPFPPAAYPSQWPGISLSTSSNPVGHRASFLANNLPCIPHAKIREKLLRITHLEINLPPVILSLLRQPAFAEPFASLYQKRQRILHCYYLFCQQIKGGFGSLHVPPFSVDPFPLSVTIGSVL